MASKFYAVKKGRTIGVFDTWNECKKSIDGFSGAIYKSFLTKQEANDFIGNSNTNDSINSNTDVLKIVDNDLNQGILVIFVDGSYDHRIKRYGYGGIMLKKDNDKITENQIYQSFNDVKYLSSRNVSGEIFGVIKSIEWAKEHNHKNIKIFYDYEGIERWAKKEWKANTDIAKLYVNEFDKLKDFFESIEFQKVAAHSSISYNDKVDLLAKKSLFIK